MYETDEAPWLEEVVIELDVMKRYDGMRMMMCIPAYLLGIRQVGLASGLEC